MKHTVDARIPSPTVSLEALGFVLTAHVRAITLHDGATLLVDSNTGKPIHVLIPWKAYIDSTGVILSIAKPTPPDDPPPSVRSKKVSPKSPSPTGPLGLGLSAILHEMITKHPLHDNKRIARSFAKRTRRGIQPETVARHRKLLEAEQAGKPVNRIGKYLDVKKGADPKTVINPSDFDGCVCKLAIANGAKRSAVRESEQFADGQLGLAEAIKKFDPTRGTKFFAFAYTYIHGRIVSGLRKRHGKPGSAKNRARVKPFSEFAADDNDPTSFLAIAKDLGNDLETREEVERILSPLDPRERRFVERRIIDGMTCQAVGQMEKPAVSQDTVSKHVRLAIEKLRGGQSRLKVKASR
jgi:RNA polymerase sigma factor (sigma-70 family)